MGTVSSESLGGGPVCVALDVVPGFEGHAVDPSDLVVRRQLLLVQPLEGSEAKEVEIKQVRRVLLEFSNLPTERNRA